MSSGLSLDPREGFIDGLIEAAEDDARIVVLDADVSRTTRTRRFRDRFPSRFYDMGIAEQNMVGVAAGLATTGLTPFAVTFAVFASLRAAEQVRTSVCYPRLNVKIVGGYAGLSNAKDGATHQSVEDLAVMRSFANLVVVTPSDALMAREIGRAVLTIDGPVYIRIEYEESPSFWTGRIPFEIGKAYVVRQGQDVTIASCGIALSRAMGAADRLAGHGVDAEVIDVPTLKPLDGETLRRSVEKTGGLVTVEDHSRIGGLGTAVTEAALEAGMRVPMRVLGIPDVFTSSGQGDELRDLYGVGRAAVEAAANSVVAEAKAGKAKGLP